MAKRRLDSLLAERGLFSSRSRAAAAVMAGEVRIGAHGERAAKPGQLVGDDVALELDERPRYVSRGGIKLANALDAFGVDPAGRRCLDAGASTGGFTDCLLQRGAEAVVALDVAYGELDWRLRQDPRVTVVERTNARALDPSRCPTPPTWSSPTSPSSRWPRCCPRCWLRRPGVRLPGAGQAAVRGRARAGRQGRRGPRPGRCAGARWWASARAARRLGARCWDSLRRACPARPGNRESFVWLGRGRASGRGGGSGGRRAKGGAVKAPKHDHGVHPPQPRGHCGAAAPAGRAGGRGRRRRSRAGRGGGEARPLGAPRRGARRRPRCPHGPGGGHGRRRHDPDRHAPVRRAAACRCSP